MRRRIEDGIHNLVGQQVDLIDIEDIAIRAGEDAAIRMCDEPDTTSDVVVVAAAGGERDVTGVGFPLSSLQEWKRERLLANDAYLIRTYESTLVESLGSCQQVSTVGSQ